MPSAVFSILNSIGKCALAAFIVVLYPFVTPTIIFSTWEAIVLGIALSLALGNQTVTDNLSPSKSRSIGDLEKSRDNFPRGPSTVITFPS